MHWLTMEFTMNDKPFIKQYFGKLKVLGKLQLTDNSRTMPQTHCSKIECISTDNGPEENGKKIEANDIKNSVSACSCGPECGPDKCDGRNRSVLVGWDSLRTRIFICLFVTFMVWLVIYVPISLSSPTQQD